MGALHRESRTPPLPARATDLLPASANATRLLGPIQHHGLLRRHPGRTDQGPGRPRATDRGAGAAVPARALAVGRYAGLRESSFPFPDEPRGVLMAWGVRCSGCCWSMRGWARTIGMRLASRLTTLRGSYRYGGPRDRCGIVSACRGRWGLGTGFVQGCRQWASCSIDMVCAFSGHSRWKAVGVSQAAEECDWSSRLIEVGWNPCMARNY
jgi:hypothetical protein